MYVTIGKNNAEACQSGACGYSKLLGVIINVGYFFFMLITVVNFRKADKKQEFVGKKLFCFCCER